MLKQIDVTKKLSKEDYDMRMAELEISMGELQRKCKEKNIPIMIVFEGLSSSGKGTMINRMITPLDPRGFKVFTSGADGEEEQMRPYFWRYFDKTPERGRINIYDQSWYQGVYNGDITANDAIKFEKLLTDDGYLIIKFFLIISKREQKKRITKLLSKKSTKWRVSKKDIKQNINYDKCVEKYDEILISTDTANAGWTVIESTDKCFATCKICSHLVDKMREAIAEADRKEAIKVAGKEAAAKAAAKAVSGYANSVLKGMDLSKTITYEDYKAKKKELSKRLYKLQNKMYLKRVPVILAFEGWDAGGKGGAIKRLTKAMDPRGYEVIPTASPNDIERAHHYLWRFWEKVPKAGHMAVFDRTWYGRVMVERIEGFATKDEWSRAYGEINDMEEQFAKSGAIVLKFFLHIDKDEQLARFTDRQNRPEKQWKITDEDWRNRDKWDEYEKAIDEMILKTSTPNAPWIVVEANSKYYARIKVLETVVNALEKRL